MDNFNQEDFKKLKELINRECKMIGSIYSPALKSEITFNSNGITHLYYKRNRSGRDKRVQFNKLRFFKISVDVLKIATTIQEYRRIASPAKDGSISTMEWFAFWSIISFKKKIRIKVIVRRVGGNTGKYHFWSLMPYWTLRHKERNISSADIDDE